MDEIPNKKLPVILKNKLMFSSKEDVMFVMVESLLAG